MKNLNQAVLFKAGLSFEEVQLVKAAPELLEALKGLAKEAGKLAEKFDVDGNGHSGTATIWGLLEDANDAIAKAEGGKHENH